MYRNLGLSRSLSAAATFIRSDVPESEAVKSRKKPQIPGNIQDESAKYQWVERARAWDIETLQLYGDRIIIAYLAGLDALARKALDYLADESNKLDNWESAVRYLELIGKIVNGETANNLYRARATWDRDNSGDKPA